MATYKIDSAHSEINFKIKHLMITNVTGSFTKFEGSMESSNEDFSDAQIHFEADVDSITTHNEQRDGHLRSPEFFDAAQFPKIAFQSTSLERISGEDYKLNGNLTMHGVTKPVILEVEFGGLTTDPWGQSKVGFEITGKINRKDFGLEWNAALETGGVMLGEDVKLQIGVQLIKQA
jgi:polyisoprenoid-binding protein YceI